LGNLSEDLMNLKLKGVLEQVESCRNYETIVNFEELKLFLDGGLLDHVVSELGNLIQDYGGKLWLSGGGGDGGGV
jgi:hypothetical protein